jgi:hypothetical protein
MIADILASLFLIGGVTLIYLGFELALEHRNVADSNTDFEEQSAADFDVFAGVFVGCLGLAACFCAALIFTLWA